MSRQLSTKERREERQHALGIDCVDRLTWKEWSPGSEYTRKILIKNVDRVSQTIQLSLPTHRKIFVTPFPEPITLSSGVSHEMVIAFRPAELVELHDAVTITVEGRGAFQIRLDCLTPYAKLAVPSSYDFDYCAIGATAHAEVQLRNTGTAPVEFSWEAPAPFCVLPKHAVLDQGEVMHLTLLFTPADACAAVGQAVCRLTGMDEVIATMKISGIGKHPFVCFQDGTGDAAAQDTARTSSSGSALTVVMEAKMNGAVTTRDVLVANPSAVTAMMRLRRSDDGFSSAFRLTAENVADDVLNAGEPFAIPRGAVQTLRVHYTPSTPGVLQSALFHLECLEGNALELEVSGTTAGPRITTAVASLDFGAVNIEQPPSEKQRTRLFTLRNPTAIDATFAWMHTSPGAAFAVQPSAGVVAAQSTLQVAVTFRPTHPILYHRRLRLLVEGAAELVNVDVFGGGYNSAVRPPALSLADVEAARLREERGLGLLTPAGLERIARAAAADDENVFGPPEESPVSPEESVTPSMLEEWRRVEEDARGSGVVMRGAKHGSRAPLSSLEGVAGRVGVTTPFGLDAPPLCIFAGKGSGEGRGQAVTVMNTADEPAVATWSVPPGPSCPYTVVPAQQTVPPHGSAVFQLHSSGAAGGATPGEALSTLECYVNFESMSAFYLAPDRCVVPPRCFTVECAAATPATSTAAQTAAKASQATAAAQVRTVAQVCLPACRLGGVSYQVIALHNRSAAAARYEVSSLLLKQVGAVELPRNVALLDPAASAAQEADVDSSVFSAFPSAGVVPPRARALVVVKFCPSEAARYEAAATFSWNPRDRTAESAAAPPASDATSIALLGEVCLPQLEWRDAWDVPASDIVFPPSCITGEVRQPATLRNPTSLPVAFRFDTSAGLLGVLRMEPESAVVPGGGRLPVTLLFSPQQPRVFSGCVQLHLEDGAAAESGGRLVFYRQQLPVYGEGVFAEVEVEPRSIDVGEAPDTQEQQAALTLYNSGCCEVQYEVRTLRIDHGDSSSSSSAAAESAAVVPRLHNSRGVLPARTHTTVLAAAQPVPGLTEFLLYVLVSGLSTELAEVPDAGSLAEAQRHPHCRWSLRAAHPAVQVVQVHFPGVARPLAWQQLSLNAVNAQLAAAGNANGADAFSFQHYVSGLAPISMDLGVAHEASAAAAVTVTLQNTGDCPAPFSLMFPTQHDANTEHWCLENAELADLQYIVDRGIITVAPSHGCIDVGATVQLHIAYSHDEVGVHRLPVLLRVGEGERRVAMVLEGRTLPPAVQVLNFHHEKVYDLLPVALGDMEPPLQYVTVSNPADEAVGYSVDVAALQAHAHDNYGFPVFQCADPQGVVPPYQTARIGFYFRPLEAKEYTVTVLVQTEAGEGYYVELVGLGYHPRHTGKAAVRRWIRDAFLRVPSQPPPPLPPLLSLPSQGGPLRLVDDVCTLGAVPYYTLCRRTCTLQLSPECAGAVRYVWRPEQPRHGDAQLVLYPREGTLQPGEQHTVQVTLYAGSTSQVVEHLLSCEVTPCKPVEDGARASQSGSRLAGAGHSRGGQRSRLSQQQTTMVLPPTPSVETLGLLVQARVMPRDDFESLYGKERLESTFMPAQYGVHVDPASSITSAPASVCADAAEMRFVATLVDELVRGVVATQSVQDSFTALCPPRAVSYAHVRARHAAAATRNASDNTMGGGKEAKSSTSSAETGAAADARESAFTAAVVTEGVLEELLRDIIQESIAAA